MTRGPSDRDRAVPQHHAGWHERAFPEEHGVADARAGHQDGAIADLAEVADGRPATVAPTIAADDAVSGSDTRRTSAGTEYGLLIYCSPSLPLRGGVA
jgi:hypothetical protein